MHMQAFLQGGVQADLRPFWTWNTKQMFVFIQVEYVSERNRLNQVSLMDNIIRSREGVNISWNIRQEYPWIDQGNFLRGRKVNLTLVWDVMPKVGARSHPALHSPAREACRRLHALRVLTCCCRFLPCKAGAAVHTPALQTAERLLDRLCAGALRQYSKSIPIGELPEQYLESSQRWGHWHQDPPRATAVDDV